MGRRVHAWRLCFLCLPLCRAFTSTLSAPEGVALNCRECRYSAVHTCDGAVRWVDSQTRLDLRCCGTDSTTNRLICAVADDQQKFKRNLALGACEEAGLRLCTPKEAVSCCGLGSRWIHALPARTAADLLEGITEVPQWHYIYSPGLDWSKSRELCWGADFAGTQGYGFHQCCSTFDPACWKDAPEGVNPEWCCSFVGVEELDAERPVLRPWKRASEIRIGSVLVALRPDQADEACYNVWSAGVALFLQESTLAVLGLPQRRLQILELGAGLGATAVVLALQNHSVVATDRSACGVELATFNAKRNLGQHRNLMRVQRWDWEGSSPGQHFDVVLSTGGIFYQGLGAAEGLCQALLRLCSNRTRLVVQVPNFYEWEEFLIATQGFRVLSRTELYYYAPDTQYTILVMMRK